MSKRKKHVDDMRDYDGVCDKCQREEDCFIVEHSWLCVGCTNEIIDQLRADLKGARECAKTFENMKNTFGNQISKLHVRNAEIESENFALKERIAELERRKGSFRKLIRNMRKPIEPPTR